MSDIRSWLWLSVLPLLIIIFAFQARQVADDPNVDHAAHIQNWNEDTFEDGRATYQESCAQCHGENGSQPPNPTAAAFTSDELKNGSDPYSIYRTLTDGFNQMLPQTWLSPEQRYQVIYYIREEFFKESNPSQYTEITQAYLEGLPKPSGQMAADARQQMEYGPALTYELESTRSALMLPLGGDVHMYYDLHTMSVPAVWTGRFVDLDATHHTEYKGGRRGRIVGDSLGVGPMQWAFDGLFKDPRQGAEKHGPLQPWLAQYEGYYLHGDKTILSYSISGREILDLPGSISENGLDVATHNFHVAPGDSDLLLAVGRRPEVTTASRYRFNGGKATVATGPAGNYVLVAGGDRVAAAGIVGNVKDLTWRVDGDGRLLLHIPAGEETRRLKLLRTAGTNPDDVAGRLGDLVSSQRTFTDPSDLIDGGPPRWHQTLTTAGKLGKGEEAYVTDDLPVPLENPWHSWMRLSGLDFFKDGRAAVSTLNGDVWIVSGIDEDLDELEWRRFATGLYEPLGLKVIDGKIYAVARDRITRLHDENGDGEADFYESFHAFDHVSNGYHAFTFGSDTDSEGNIYAVKSGRKTDYPIPGSVLKISPDGTSSEIIGTGFRHPNGMTVGPDDRVFVSDNQGGWMPASKVSYVRGERFYGYVGWEHNTVDRDTFQQPVFWLPHDVDDSSGGQAWVTDERWGPLAGNMIHTSYGAGRVFYVLMQEIDDELQAAVVPFPWKFSSGTMRARMNPADGQLYVIGQKGWGVQPTVTTDGAFYRIRHTGRSAHMLTGARVTPDGIELSFPTALDEASATDTSRYTIKRWNYLWSENYGSLHYLPGNSDQEGEERVEIRRITLADGGKTARLSFARHRTVDQMEVTFQLEAADGTPIEQIVYWTIKRIPGARP